MRNLTERSTGQFPSVLGWLCRLHVRTYIYLRDSRLGYDALRVVATAAGRLPQNRAKEALRAKSERASSLWKPWLFDYCGVPQVFYGLNDRKGKGISKNRYTDLDTRHLAPPRQPPCNIRHPSGHGPYAIAFPHCVVSLIIIKQFLFKCRYHSKYSALKTFISRVSYFELWLFNSEIYLRIIHFLCKLDTITFCNNAASFYLARHLDILTQNMHISRIILQVYNYLVRVLILAI